MKKSPKNISKTTKYLNNRNRQKIMDKKMKIT